MSTLIKSAIFRALFLGVAFAVSAGLVIFVFFPRTDAVLFLIYPGMLTFGALSPFVPTQLVYWLDSEGGPRSFLTGVLLCAFGFWTLLLATFLLVASRKRRVWTSRTCE